MERIYCSGDIHLNKPLSLQAAYNIYKKLNDTALSSWAEYILDAVDDDCIVISKTLDNAFYEYIDIFLTALDDNEYIANGEIECVDNDEDFKGVYIIENNDWEYYDKEDIWQVRASDNELIEALKRRGYKIAKEDK